MWRVGIHRNSAMKPRSTRRPICNSHSAEDFTPRNPPQKFTSELAPHMHQMTPATSHLRSVKVSFETFLNWMSLNCLNLTFKYSFARKICSSANVSDRDISCRKTIWCVTPIASQLPFSNLKWQPSWFAIANWMSQFSISVQAPKLFVEFGSASKWAMYLR
jgi:hypothetical protein